MINTTLCYLEQDGKYLMLCRNKKKQDLNAGKWIGVGGKFEAGETPEECLLREVREETGLELTEYTFHGKIFFLSDTWEDEVMYLYTATGFRGEICEDCPEGDLKWVPKEEILSMNLWEGDKYFLRELIKGTGEMEMELRYEGDKLVGYVNRPVLKAENVDTLLDARFIRTYDLKYQPGSHYFLASRRSKDELVALKDEAQLRALKPDAVGCIVIIKVAGKEPRLLLLREMRFATGQFLLGVPAGLIDPEDLETEEPVFRTAIRELKEETGLDFTEKDEIKMVNPFLFSSPGMTDESNAMVQITINRDEEPTLTQAGTVGGECIGGYAHYVKDEAKKLLMTGTDESGIYYSTYTWIALMTFVSGAWE